MAKGGKGAGFMELKEVQERFDLEKCNDSRIAGRDTCGDYEFCGCCVKDEEYPCARARQRYEECGAEEKVYYRLAVLRPVKQTEESAETEEPVFETAEESDSALVESI